VVIDFRGFDTLLEITVFSLAGIGIFTLLRFASRQAGDVDPEDSILPPLHLPTRGLGSLPTSPLIHMLGYLMLPMTLMIAFIHMMYGHDQPGDGFTAGVILSLGVAFWYVVFGYSTTHRRLIWIRPGALVPAGLLLGFTNGVLAAYLKGSFLAHVDYGTLMRLPLPEAFHFSSSFLFEVAICLTVLGGSAYVLETLGRPRETDREAADRLKDIAQVEEQS
jgi:multicomponent K+:H+ antiporter subunit A